MSNQNVHFVRISLQLEAGCRLVPDIDYFSEKSQRDELQKIGLPKLRHKNIDPRKAALERRGRRQFQVIEIETVSTEMAQGEPKDSSGGIESIHFFSGNHCVEMTKGIIHLFKEELKTPIDSSNRSLMLCMLAVPAYVPLHDLLQFMSPFSPHVEHIRVIRDSKPSVYMVLLKFRSQKATDEFFSSFNGKPFNSIEGDICHLVYVAKVEVIKGDEEERSADVPLTGHMELPTCPVCLERMDESVEGILTILCNHSFHDVCLAKWQGDSTCPVCRYTQTPQQVAGNCCQTCGATDNLWICLVCGHIGCGRYVSGHAHTHFTETAHTYAMQVENGSVWDYAGDNYVHRLVQNKTDGKLVQLETQSEAMDEKVDSVQLEYTYMLTSQLEKQRRFFEDALDQQAKETVRQINELKEKTRIAIEERKELESKMSQVTKERDSLRRKLDTVTAQCTKLKHDLIEEKEVSSCLLQDQQKWQAKMDQVTADVRKSKEETGTRIKDLEEQLRDVMFFLEAKSKIEKQPEELREELQEASIVVSPPPESSGTRGRNRKKKQLKQTSGSQAANSQNR